MHGNTASKKAQEPQERRQGRVGRLQYSFSPVAAEGRATEARGGGTEVQRRRRWGVFRRRSGCLSGRGDSDGGDCPVTTALELGMGVDVGDHGCLFRHVSDRPWTQARQSKDASVPAAVPARTEKLGRRLTTGSGS